VFLRHLPHLRRPAWADKLPAPMSDERDLLTELSHYRENSRLSCQVEITAALSGSRSPSPRTRVARWRFSATGCTSSPIIGGLIARWRIWQNLQKLRQRQNDSWDARLIDQLRKRGSDPFKPHDVDFFLAFPTAERREQLARSCAPRASTPT
jgi:hypothetical protein